MQAGEGNRTLNLKLGKLLLCQLSYAREGVVFIPGLGAYNKNRIHAAGGWFTKKFIPIRQTTHNFRTYDGSGTGRA